MLLAYLLGSGSKEVIIHEDEGKSERVELMIIFNLDAYLASME